MENGVWEAFFPGSAASEERISISGIMSTSQMNVLSYGANKSKLNVDMKNGK